jgi:hypothetical protein
MPFGEMRPLPRRQRQVLGAIDLLEDEIVNLGVTAKLGDGRAARPCDLQILPSAGRLSFRLPAETGEHAHG